MRAEDWPEALADYVDAHRSVPFEWGVNDCATFAAGAVHAITGTRLQLPIATSAQAYAHLVRDHGSLAKMTDDVMGAQIVPAYARRGDIVLIEMDGRECLAVCLGAVAAAPAADGLRIAPMGAATAAWAV